MKLKDCLGRTRPLCVCRTRVLGNHWGCKPRVSDLRGSIPLCGTEYMCYTVCMFPWETNDYSQKTGRSRDRPRKKAKQTGKPNYLTYGHPKWYSEYLKTPHWLEFKQRWRASKRSRCCMICYDTHYALHHWTYERVGNELLDDVVPLCRAHHLKAHALEKNRVPLAEAHKQLK
jgi:hypothetical protein